MMNPIRWLAMVLCRDHVMEVLPSGVWVCQHCNATGWEIRKRWRRRRG